MFELDEDSHDLKKPIQYFSFSEKSHFHCAILSPDKKYIFISDLGEDKIHRFSISENKKNLLVNHKISYEYKIGNQAGPRHMIFSKD